MVAIRLRHPKGVATINVALDSDSFTVQDLQQEIYTASDILPSLQNCVDVVKTGYPPQSLTVVPELPVTSLGLRSGDQIIVNEIAKSAAIINPPARTPLDYTANLLSAGPSILTQSPLPTAPSEPTTGRPDFVETEGGAFIHRIVPDDNSCLFSAVALVFEQTIAKAPEMRTIVAEGIRNDPATYNEAILGMPPSQYITAILKPSTWGGAIELGILAAHYKTEIASIDVETGRIDSFSPPSGGNAMRCILVYSGIHYDAATLAPSADAAHEWHQTIFPVSRATDDGDPVLVAARKLAEVLRAKKAFTNTATFDLKCEQCGQGLKGEKDARAHAARTGHVRFGEY